MNMYTVRQKKRNQLIFVSNFIKKCSAVAEMGDRSATINMGRKQRGAAVPLLGGAASPSNTI